MGSLTKASFALNLTGTVSKTFGGTPISVPLKHIYSTVLTGTGAITPAADRAWQDLRTVTAAPESLDLSGVLTDLFGDVITSARLKALVIENLHATAELLVGGAAANAVTSLFGTATDKVRVRPGGAVAFVAPDSTAYGITAGTADLVKVDPGASTIQYKITAFFAST